MANPIYGTENFSTTLNVGGGINNSQTTGIVLTSVSGLNTNGGVLGFTWSSTIDTATYEEIEYGGVSGNELTGVTRGVAGTSAKSHLNGATVVAVVSSLHNNRIADKLRSVDATLAQDPNGNEIIKTNYVSSAVNEIEVKNAATGNSPTISATGSDTDIDINLTPKGAGDVNIPTSANIQVNGSDPKRGIYVPASALFPATTTGCAALAQGETTTNKINYKYLAFDASTEEYAWFHMPTPDYWDLGTITVKFHWTAASSSGDVIWGAAGLCRSDDDALDTALGTAQTVTDTLTATGDEHTTAATSAITIGGTPAKGDKLYLRVYRDADAGGDTLAADAHLTGITIKFNAGTFSDE